MARKLQDTSDDLGMMKVLFDGDDSQLGLLSTPAHDERDWARPRHPFLRLHAGFG